MPRSLIARLSGFSMRSAVLGALAVTLAACAGRPGLPEEAASDGRFLPEEDLVGRTVGEGQFSTITGVERGFVAYLDGRMEGDTLVLVEDFVFDDGETDRKTWRITRVGPGEYVGTREDVVGEARGYLDGNAFRLEYTAELPTEDGGSRRVGFRDILVEQADGTVLNRANVGWYGFHVGRVELLIRPPEEGEWPDDLPTSPSQS